MLCPRCHGARELAIAPHVRLGDYVADTARAPIEHEWIACPYCAGVGHIHCCEGDCSQPEPIVLARPAAKQFLDANYPRFVTEMLKQ